MSADDELVEILRAYAGVAHGDEAEDSLEWRAADAIERLTTALAQERERCAKVADEFNNEQNGPVAAAISRAIRDPEGG